MEIRNSLNPTMRRNSRAGVCSLGFSVLLVIFLLLGGCGAPGEPVPPSPPVPNAIKDLAGRQAGDGVELVFTPPTKSIIGEPLATPPTVEILRGSFQPDGSPDAKSFRIVYTVPGSLMDNSRGDSHAQFTDPISPEEIKNHPGSVLAYMVRTRASAKRASADSNIISVRVFPVPEKIPSVETRITETAIELNWPAATRTSAGDPISAMAGYHIYRGEIDPASADAAKHDLTQAKWQLQLVLLASAESNKYRDISFEFGKVYLYVIRSAVATENGLLESDGSAPAIVAPVDTFPPAAPQGLVAVVLPGEMAGSLQVDLSWSISSESDLAGYRVYRSAENGARGELITPDLLPTPAIRDTSVQPGQHYWYSVTAIDRAGNESVASEPVLVEVAEP